MKVVATVKQTSALDSTKLSSKIKKFVAEAIGQNPKMVEVYDYEGDVWLDVTIGAPRVAKNLVDKERKNMKKILLKELPKELKKHGVSTAKLDQDTKTSTGGLKLVYKLRTASKQKSAGGSGNQYIFLTDELYWVISTGTGKGKKSNDRSPVTITELAKHLATKYPKHKKILAKLGKAKRGKNNDEIVNDSMRAIESDDNDVRDIRKVVSGFIDSRMPAKKSSPSLAKYWVDALKKSNLFDNEPNDMEGFYFMLSDKKQLKKFMQILDENTEDQVGSVLKQKAGDINKLLKAIKIEVSKSFAKVKDWDGLVKSYIDWFDADDAVPEDIEMADFLELIMETDPILAEGGVVDWLVSEKLIKKTTASSAQKSSSVLDRFVAKLTTKHTAQFVKYKGLKKSKVLDALLASKFKIDKKLLGKLDKKSSWTRISEVLAKAQVDPKEVKPMLDKLSKQ